jgi:signal transduction histidine kinase/ligand-binding sensor domain-containing protein
MPALKYITRWTAILLFMVVVYPWLHIYSQPQRPLIEYTTENGLSLNSVNDLIFDKQGFLWVATADGLQRFDGYRFQTFRHDALDKKSIPENNIAEIFEDNIGNLWISHRTGIAFKLKGKNEFTDLTASMPVNAFRYRIACVNETDSTVWVINYPTGIYAVNKFSLLVSKVVSFNLFSNKEVIYPLSQLRKKNDLVWFRIGADISGDIFQVTDDGLKQFRNREKIKILFFIPAQHDSMVVVTDKMLYKALTKDPFTPVRILNTSSVAAYFENEYLPVPKKIAKNQWLLLGRKKISLYDENTEAIIPFPHNEYFSEDLIRYLHVATADRHENSWLGYNGIGGIKVITLQKFNLFNRPFKNAMTYTLAADGKDKIFTGIYLGDIEVYDKEGRFLFKINLPDAHKRIGSPRAMAMIDSASLIVKSTLDELYAIDTRKRKLQLLSHLLPPNTDSIPMDFEMDMKSMRDGELWFSYRNRILSLKKGNTGFQCFIICKHPVNERINSFFYNSSGQLWIGTLTGAWVFENNKFEKIELPVVYVKHINQHPDGRYWITTTDGIYILKNKNVIKHLNVKDGLPNSFVYSVLFDDEGNSWVSTNRGLAKIDSSFRITTYSGKEGLQGDEFNTKGYCKTNDGTLYFAGVNGINFFKPQTLVNKSEPSQTMLTNVEVNNQPYLPYLQPEFINTINLPHHQNNIRLSFSYMDFTVPGKNQYKFWLKGFQDDWSLPQTNNIVQYILPVGEYELHVLGANYEGVWNKEPLIVKINILPPWYQTNWAKAIFAFLILSFVAAVFYFISRRRYLKKLGQLQMEQEVQKEKQRLSRDLHDNLGSQLTWLSNNIFQLERAQQEQKPIEQKLETLKEGSSELMQTLRETIWIMNKEKIGAVDFFDKLVTHAARHIEVYPPLQLQTEENISINHQLNSGTALQLFRICQEAITNACKHAQAGLLSIKANADEKHFSISIRDNGKGFDLSNDNPGHYGLQNMLERARESNLQLNIESSPGKGTAITISVQN